MSGICSKNSTKVEEWVGLEKKHAWPFFPKC